MVRKVKQSVKQSVNVKVHIGDSHRKKGKRRNYKKKASASGEGYSAPAQAYAPVYIQSGYPSQPAAEENPILKAIQELNGNVVRHHKEVVTNHLLKQVGERSHISGIYHRDDNPNIDDMYETNSDVSAITHPKSGYNDSIPPRTAAVYPADDFEADIVKSPPPELDLRPQEKRGRGRPIQNTDPINARRRENARIKREEKRKEKLLLDV